MRQFLIAVGVLLLIGAAAVASGPSSAPDHVGRARGYRGVVPRRGNGFLWRVFRVAQGLDFHLRARTRSAKPDRGSGDKQQAGRNHER